MFQKIRDPISCLTHLLGAVLALGCCISLVSQAIPYGPTYIFSFLVFGSTLVLLYSASSVYHMVHVSDRTLLLLRRIDHSMIFIFIAGTYTPVCLIALSGPWGWGMLVFIWSLAIAGCLLKIFLMHAPRLVSTIIYIMMGWVVLIAFYPLSRALSSLSLFFLVGGGISYTAGAVFYAAKRPQSRPGAPFGFHEIFHLFVMMGSFFHVLFMFRLFPDNT